VHRSRLAEAYMKTLPLEGFTYSSSGVEAEYYTPKFKSPYTDVVLNRHPLLKPHMSTQRQQSTKELLAKPDVVVCLDKSVYDDAASKFDLDPRKTQIWHVEDINKRVTRIRTDLNDWNAIPELEDDIFAKIKQECDQLAKYLTKTAWVDVRTADNQLTGLRLPMEWITDRGLWHAGVHVVVRTSDGKYIVGKRDNKIVFAPGMLQITLGGGIDAGETPIQAARRETHEELGVDLHEKHFEPLFTYKLHSYHPHYKKRTKGYVYVYSARLPVHSTHLRPQPGEVEELRVLTPREVKRALRTHRVKHFGPLQWTYKLYDKAIAYSDQSV
jgi:isopentenyl-diphosphate delta-isomerase